MGRPRAGQERLNRERILEAALRIVDEEGMEALSMRRLGAELGVDPMSVYRHLPGKEAVVSGLVEQVFSEMRLPPSGGATWQERVRAWATAYVELARSHPNLVLRIVSDAAAVSDAMLQVSEPLYAALWDAGLPPREAALAAGTVVDFVHGHALSEESSSTPDDAAPVEDSAFERDMLARLEAQPAESFPTMLRVFRVLAEDATDMNRHPVFDGSLDVLLAGIEAMTYDNAG